MALIGFGGLAALSHMALLHTLCVIGLLLVGYLGIWRLASLFPTARARVAALVVYAAVPLPGELLRTGRWAALACYAATPWAVHLLRRLAGIETATSGGSASDSDIEHYSQPAPRKLVRLFAQLSLVTSVAFAFAPSFAFVLVGVGVALAFATVLVGGHLRAAGTMAIAAFGAVAVAVIANLPWSAALNGSDGWTAVVGVPGVSARSLGVGRLARFLDTGGGLGPLSLLVFLPVVAAPLIARAWRFAWAARAAA